MGGSGSEHELEIETQPGKDDTIEFTPLETGLQTEAGETVGLDFDAKRIVVFDPESGRALDSVLREPPLSYSSSEMRPSPSTSSRSKAEW